jgi:hypothetical protein
MKRNQKRQRKCKKKYLRGGVRSGTGKRPRGHSGGKKCKRNRPTVKAGKTVAKFEDKIHGKEECRILTEC